jgi:phosphatidate phosphatase APP1
MRRSILRTLRARLRDPVMILPYLGFGTADRLRLSGRVLQDEGFRAPVESDGRWRNLAAFFKRLESDELPHARLRARFGDQVVETRADRQGYFALEFARGAAPGWHEVQLELLERPIKAVGRVLVPDPAARFVVASDIDDTVVQSDVGRKLRMLLSIAFSNARTRKPFKGVGAFYRALHAGINPIFYVSKSPWNLYAPLLDYLDAQGLPQGPLFLRDFGLRMERHHKQAALLRLLEAYALPFILIGDSGEDDPEIYSSLVKRFPQRIRAIYIRSVNPDPARIASVDRLIAEVAKTGCQLVLATDSDQAAAHAAAEGLIDASALAGIRSDVRADAASPPARS